MEQGGDVRTAERPLKGVAELSRRIVNLAGRGIPRIDFLRGLADLLLQFSDCDSLQFCVYGQVEYRVHAVARPEPAFRFEPTGANAANRGSAEIVATARSNLRALVAHELQSSGNLQSSCFTPYGSFWTGELSSATAPDGRSATRSCAIVPFVIDTANLGLLRLEWAQADAFTQDAIESYEAVAETIGFAIAERRTQAALRERVKELTCLYGIARVIEDSGDDVDSALRRIAETLPPAWQFPAIAVARISLDGVEYATGPFEHVCARQVAAVTVHGAQRGTVEVGYVDDTPYAATEPFLEEERHLIDAVAREVGEFVARRQAAAERSLLEQQLRHADRLATIGHLAAGVAHEINEPLGSILGFAQLAKKVPNLPESVTNDLGKIIASCLQTREIVYKLKLFARQAPIQKTWVSLTEVAAEACSMVEGRCANEGIDLVRHLDPDLPNVHADPVQLGQVVVNLVVNAIQAMPDGGTLTLVTRSEEKAAVIEVQDTGVGMAEDVISEIFRPFFTTKDVGQGTGLGLSVVHGIVTAHGGTIHVDSEMGKGARFRVRLPLSGVPSSEVAQEAKP